MAEKKAFLLRLDPGLWTALERLAQAELRSVNGQIEFLLRDALSRRGVGPARAPATTPVAGVVSGNRGRRGKVD
ncbi:MAG TPA: toxin-antitoxin system HicB family antitoxin [Casimicrobiaceae bacterium]|nr:toxin-antitoxin system HicB family antitoxin [Casimicrobiaceae bacterium]